MNKQEIKKFVKWFNDCERYMTFMTVHGLMRSSERKRIQANIEKMFERITGAENENT